MTTYEGLTAPFSQTSTRSIGGVDLTYITGEACVTRLNEVLGVSAWSFRVVEHGYNQEADEVWVLGEISAMIDETHTLRQQFGSQKLKRGRSNQLPLDIGFDLKGASTDALKKCASLIGVGLYLSHKEESQDSKSDDNDQPAPRRAVAAPARTGGGIICEECGEPLKETKFKDGTSWSPEQLAAYGQRKHQRNLCMDDYRKANDAVKLAAMKQQDGETIPF